MWATETGAMIPASRPVLFFVNRFLNLLAMVGPVFAAFNTSKENSWAADNGARRFRRLHGIHIN